MSDLLTLQTAIVVALTGLAFVASFHDIRWFAFAWAFTFPIDVVTGVPGWVFDALRYTGSAWIVLRVRPDLPAAARPLLRTFAVLLLALAAVRTLAALANHDGPSVRFGVLLALGTVMAHLVVLRTTVHRTIVAGYLAGIAFSAAVSLQQALGWSTIAPANRVGNRYPGLSTYTSVATWHMAIGFVLACYLIAVGARSRDRRFWPAAAAAPLYALGLVTNGAQGGLVGVAVAFTAIAWAGRSRITRPVLLRGAAAIAALVVAVGLVAAFGGVDIPSVTDYDGSFHNERTRVESWYDGASAMVDHPVTGVSGREYLYGRGNRIMPHVLPLESGALAGVAGFLTALAVVGYTGWLVLRGPADRRGETLVAYGLLAALVANTLMSPQGPFQGIARSVPLFLIVLHASVADRTPDPEPEITPTPASASARRRLSDWRGGAW